MITIGGENLIDYVQTEVKDGLPVYTAIPGGSCYNVAIAAARQGQTVSYVTPISTDSLGNVLAQRLIDDGIQLATPRTDAPTSLAVVSVNNGQPSYQFYRSDTADRQITPDTLDAAISQETRVFHIGSLALIEGADADLWEQRFATLSANDVITSLDPNARPVVVKDKDQYVARLLRVMKHARVLKLSDEDLEYLAPDQPLMEAFEQICSETQAAIIILTKGADGAVVRCGSTQFDVAATQANPLVDTVGAGDTFMGTLLVEISKTGLSASELGSIAENELTRIVTRAAKAAALNCQSAGCNPPYEQDL
ncbi:MAG: carbohydrate kinase [Rhodobacteraceae bacterium]|nr:carbohydrate kinase [Paracoccaceae bacterium]